MCRIRNEKCACLAARRVTGTRYLQSSSLPLGTRRLEYVPELNANGYDFFDYASTDCAGDSLRSSRTARVEFNIAPVNDAPLLNPNQIVELVVGETLALRIADFVSDVDDAVEDLTVTFEELPVSGVLYENDARVVEAPYTMQSAQRNFSIRFDNLEDIPDPFDVATSDDPTNRRILSRSWDRWYEWRQTKLRYRAVDRHGSIVNGVLEMRVRSTVVNCPPGHVVRIDPANGEPTCEVCPVGTYEKSRQLCEPAPSYGFIGKPGSNISALEPCGNVLQVQELVYDENGDAVVKPSVRGTSRSDCTCRPDYYALNSTSSDPECLPCPRGARCLGHTLQPMADDGFAQLLDAQGPQPIFHECTNNGCLRGTYRQGVLRPYTCAQGYRTWNESRLCSLCTEEDGYAMVINRCIVCDYGLHSGWYFVLALMSVLFWFPLLRELVGHRFKSLYVSIPYLQFLGIFASFGVPFGLSFSDTLDAFSYFNLNLEMRYVSLACFGMDYQVCAHAPPSPTAKL